MNLLAMKGDRREFSAQMEAIRSAGYEGVQFAELGTAEELTACLALKLGIAGSGRVNHPSEAGSIAEALAGGGYECGTLHVGWGIEDDTEAGRLIESILQASDRWRIPLYIETHRATICQDMWRTVQFVRAFPEMRFNGDFSHWYAGQEMVYGGFEKKFKFLEPVLERVRFVHGRIANPGCIQVPVVPEAEYVEHFRQLWTASFQGFLAAPDRGPFICFAPELLGSDIYYARTFGGAEESNRWEQSLILKEMAEQCFASAKLS